jgi:hypothetical protein
MPTYQEIKSIGTDLGIDMSFITEYQIQDFIEEKDAVSLPNGFIYIKPTVNMSEKEKAALLAHEIEHQSQYQNGSPAIVFAKLLQEAQTEGMAYVTPGNLEYDAQQVQDRARAIY